MLPGKDIKKRHYSEVQMDAKHHWKSSLIGFDNNEISMPQMK